MRRSFLLALLLANFAHSDIVVNTQSSSVSLVRFPVYFVAANTSVSGSACLDLYRSRHSFSGFRVGTESWIESTGIVLPNTTVSISFNHEIPTDRWSSQNICASIGVNRVSNIANEWQSFILLPTSNRTGQLIITPRNVSEYVLDGDMYYAQNVHAAYWGVRMAVRVVESVDSLSVHAAANDLISEPCFIHSQAKYMYIPRSAFDDLMDRFGRLQVPFIFTRNEDGETRIFLMNPTQAQIDSLPQIQYLLSDDNGDQINIGLIEPREYVADNPMDTTQKEVLIRTQRGPSCSLGPLLLRKVVMHFDAVNNRVGFGEPIADIAF